MGAAAVPVALGAGGLLLQNQANNDARSAANKANRNAKSLVDRQLQISQMLQSAVQGADRAGAFDPQAQLDQLARDTTYQSGLDQTNAATASRVLGFRPGDSEPLLQNRGISDSYRLQYGARANEIRRNALTDKINAYKAIDPSALNSGIQYYGNQQGLNLSQIQSPGPLLQNLMPYLNNPARRNPSIAFGSPANGSSR